MTRRRRALLAIVAVVAGAVVTALALGSPGQPASGSSSTVGVMTTSVVRTTLASLQQVQGKLVPASASTLVAQQASGVITAMASPGTVIARGDVLYRVDGQAVRLLYGTQAAWRALEPGIDTGADVTQLQRNLLAMGYTANGALRVGDRFDWATAVAIEEWQRGQGVPETGVLPAGSVAFATGPVRVVTQRAIPGAPVQIGTPVLDISSAALVVSVALDPSLRQLVHTGDHVYVQLPEGQTIPGRVTRIGEATAVSSAASAAGAGGSSQSGSDSSLPGNSSAQVAVPLTVALTHPAEARGLDQVPVTVQITDTVHHNVLAVPIGALLATANGGYAVAVDSRGTRRLIAVVPGLFDGGRVQVSSPSLEPGMRVEEATQ